MSRSVSGFLAMLMEVWRTRTEDPRLPKKVVVSLPKQTKEAADRAKAAAIEKREAKALKRLQAARHQQGKVL